MYATSQQCCILISKLLTYKIFFTNQRNDNSRQVFQDVTTEPMLLIVAEKILLPQSGNAKDEARLDRERVDFG